jgi:uroporphyrin-III C-methyltransferase/precorrin-2 dehydrogenase/sirohydrochlorin ferrochelatase
MRNLLPLFLTLAGRDVVLVGGGRVAASKLQALLDAGARVRVVAPAIDAAIETSGVEILQRPFEPADLDGAWLVVAAATPDVNREVAAAAEERRIFVNAVDDPANATAFLSGTLRRDGVTIAVSTSGAAPALTALLREALEDVLPEDLARWMEEALAQRSIWRRDRVPMVARKPKLLEALNKLYTSTAEDAKNAERMKSSFSAGFAASRPNRVGHVSLVGAGPGDPALLTRRAIARLRAADLVLYDALIDDRILRYARKAQRFFAGKRAGRHAMTQETIHAVMIRAARRGRRVVRLKGGDPFVFGRGGEEALALRRAGIPFDVVPGVSSAIAAAELAGIPVTHRGLSSAFLVVSGHDQDVFRSAVGALPPNGVTLVVLMGMGRSTEIAAALMEIGWAVDTPAAIVLDASLAGQQVWRGTIQELSWLRAGRSAPATIIVGDVVQLAADATATAERKYVTGT